MALHPRLRPGLVPALALLAACSAAPEVRWYGSLREVMQERRTGPRVRLDQLLPDEHLYALGALAGLEGEITVLAGEAWVARPIGANAAHTERSSGAEEAACLLVSARVSAWRTVTISASIQYAELDATIAELATAAGVQVDRPFAFRIEGTVRDLRWHVIDGRRIPPGLQGPAVHRAAAVPQAVGQVEAHLLGFHSRAHEGVFTHHGTTTHVHCVIPALQATGHVDHVVVLPGAKVSFAVP